MGRESAIPIKTPVESTDEFRGLDSSGNSKSFSADDVKEFIDPGSVNAVLQREGEGTDDDSIVSSVKFVVGSPSAGKEFIGGSGNSYGVGLEDSQPGGTPKVGSAWHCDIANTTGLTIVSATDITTTLASDSGSTTGLFGGTTTGKYLLIGSDYTFGGAKAKIDTLGVVEPPNIQGEYLMNATPTWFPVNYMVTDADFPFAQKAWNIATCSSCHEQWRFAFDPDFLPVPWDKVTLNINGTNYTKYWARFRITSDITTDVVMEQLKLHTNRFEINDTGNTEHFGVSRYYTLLQSGIENFTNNAAGSAQNANVAYAPGITALRSNNVYRNGFTDNSAIITQTIPKGLDTSIPLILDISYYPVSNVAGTVELEAHVVKVDDGFLYDGTGTATSYSGTDVISVAAQDARRTLRIKIPVNELTNEGGMVINLVRDAQGGSSDDLSSNIVITHFVLGGYNWQP